MVSKKWLLVVAVCVTHLFVGFWGCSDSHTTHKSDSNPTVNPTTKGYPNGSLLAGQEHLSDDGVVIIDARSVDAYNSGHIPGEINLPWKGFCDSSINLKSVSELETEIGSAGIKEDSWMIIYDDTTASFGAAGRLFWMFEYLGCSNVRILDG